MPVPSDPSTPGPRPRKVVRFYLLDHRTVLGEAIDVALLALDVVFVGIFGDDTAPNPGAETFGDAFYYTVVTLDGRFRDIRPVTAAGQWVTVGSILAAVVVTPRQTSRVVREWTTREKVTVTCPECGLSAHDFDATHCEACGHVMCQETDATRPNEWATARRLIDGKRPTNSY